MANTGKRKLKTRLIFEYKLNQISELERRKSRMVGTENQQKQGEDFRETWPTMLGQPRGLSTWRSANILPVTAWARGKL